jgi:filamentous hemagglutinin
VNSPGIIQEIIATGKKVPDPGGIPGAMRYEVPGTMSRPGVAAGDPDATVKGTYELVIDLKTNTVYHFLFRSSK